jgi:hypothetical protein
MAAWQYGACKSSQPRTSPQVHAAQGDTTGLQGKAKASMVRSLCVYVRVCVCVCSPVCENRCGVRCRAVYRLSVLCFVSPPPASPRHRLVLYYIIQTRVADMPWTRRSVTGGGRPGLAQNHRTWVRFFCAPRRGESVDTARGREGRAIGEQLFFRFPLVFGPVLANDNEQANGCRGRAGRTKTRPELIGEK